MKKLLVFALAALLVVAFTMPAAALESQFGGYWRTRMWTAQNMTGEDKSEAWDVSAVDTRTRLYYTAVFHENLKFVNKFEFDAAWGSISGSRAAGAPTNRGYGLVGADGANIEIKNSYADFNLGPVNAKVGVQGAKLARGFLVDDDFSGAIVTFNGETFAIPLIWLRVNEGGNGKDANDEDVDYFGIAPSFKAGGVKINPYVVYAYSKNLAGYADPFLGYDDPEELGAIYAGLDLDAKLGIADLWFTGIYLGGSVDLNTRTAAGDDSVDFKAWLAAVGGSVGMNWGNIHGQFFYATGDDSPGDDEIEQFAVLAGQSYYWSEIMGYGILGDVSYARVSNNAPADKIGNIMAGNIGVTVKPMDKLSITLDAWYAALAEDIVTLKGSEENYLGTEVDLKITYQLVQGLNLDIVGAYLFAGDATTMEAENDANPYEIDTRLSLSF